VSAAVLAMTPLDRYPPLTGLTESEIVAAFRRTSEARPCVCGGVVVADRLDPGPGIREHQQEPVHAIWRELRDIDGVQ
jgi:hypothetical protein